MRYQGSGFAPQGFSFPNGKTRSTQFWTSLTLALDSPKAPLSKQQHPAQLVTGLSWSPTMLRKMNLN